MEKQANKKNDARVTWLVSVLAPDHSFVFQGLQGTHLEWSLSHLECCLAPGLGSPGLQGICVWGRMLLKYHACPSAMAGPRLPDSVPDSEFSDILPLPNCHSDIQKMALVARRLA